MQIEKKGKRKTWDFSVGWALESPGTHPQARKQKGQVCRRSRITSETPGTPTPPVEGKPPTGLERPVLDLDGKTEDGSVPYNILLKQLECMR